MRYFIALLILLSIGCTRDGSISTTEPAPSITEPNYKAYFDSLASFGARYGFFTVVPIKAYDIILSTPTTTTISATILCYQNYEGFISCNGKSTSVKSFEYGKPQTIVIDGLTQNSRYTYKFCYRKKGEQTYNESAEYRFNTPKSSNSAFTFAVIADSHLDANSDTLTYQTTLKNVAGESNDFIIDLGDTFMVDKYGQDWTISYGQFIAQRYYYGGICNSLPLFFVQGNHDGETGAKKADMNSWTKSLRESFFPTPSKENYYAWEWGDVLMIVLDPYTYTSLQGSKDPWQRTLGNTQYRWLESTLKNSTKPFKFVFIHNLVGGVDADGQSRGGAEVAPYWEWGGHNLDGVDEFAVKRPGWSEPIHNLLKRYGVQAVFHGHDHLYAHQEYDGIVYQCLQQPSLKRYDKLNYGDTYGYKNGVIKYNPGHLRISVSSTSAKIEYISTQNSVLDSYSFTL